MQCWVGCFAGLLEFTWSEVKFWACGGDPNGHPSPIEDQSRDQQLALNVNTPRYRDESIHHDRAEKSKNEAEGGGGF